MRYFDTKRHKWGVLAFIVAIPLMVWACELIISNVYLEQTDPETGEQVLYANVGEEVTFKFDGHIAIDGDTSNETFIVAMLAPTSWNLARNATVTYTEDKYEPGVDLPMTVIPDTESPNSHAGMTWGQALKGKYGVMSNVLNDMEWVAFQSKVYGTINGTINFVVTIKCNAGNANLKFRPAFVIAHSNHGIGSNTNEYAIAEGDCFEVLGADGPITDYCTYHYYATTPLQSLQDDFVTFTFQSDINANELSDCDEIYWDATAYTDANPTTGYKAEKALMKRQSEDLPRYDLTIWPEGFFNIPKDEIITHIEYQFTNADGTKTVTLSDDSRDNDGEDVPEGEKTPFTFYFTCD